MSHNALRIDIEDIEWMAATGECTNGAAARLGFKTPGALDTWLRRHGRPDLAVTLGARNPRDWNRAGDGSSLMRAVLGETYVQKEARRNEQKKAQRREARAA